MNKEIIGRLIADIHSIAEKHTVNEFNVAMYIYTRLGMFTFVNYVDDTDLEKINDEFKKHHTLFDEELNYQIDRILNKD